MHSIRYTAPVGPPTLEFTSAQGNVVVSRLGPSVQTPTLSASMFEARDAGLISLYIVDPVTGLEIPLSSSAQADRPESGLDVGEWQPLPLANNWVVIPDAFGPAYRRLGLEVEVAFGIRNGTSLTLFNTPVGYRSPKIVSKVCQIHASNDAADFGHLQIRPDGDIVLEHPGNLSGHSVWASFQFPIV